MPKKGEKHSEETKVKLRDAWTRRGPVSVETKRKMSEAWEHRAPVSDETRKKMSESAFARYQKVV